MPSGTFHSGMQLPTFGSTVSVVPEITLSPAFRPLGARMYARENSCVSSRGYSMSAIRLVRHGSYSIWMTVASTLSRVRLKSMTRYRCLWPPPRNREVVIPWLFRPPFLGLGLSSAFSGRFSRGKVQSAKSDTIPARRPAEVGLYCLMPIAVPGVRCAVDGVRCRKTAGHS